MNYRWEALLKVADNRYALIEILSKRSRELRNRDESMLISFAIDQSIDELLDHKIKFTDYNK